MSKTIKKALFAEGHAPKGGTCISVFLVLRGKGGILVGKMTRPEIWVERFLVGEAFARVYTSSNKWVLPASHLKYGEKPEDAAVRVLTDQVGTDKTNLSLMQIQSHLSQDPKDPEAAHWDLCFVYGGTIKGRIERPEWFSELRFLRPRELRAEDFTRGHGDVLNELRILRA